MSLVFTHVAIKRPMKCPLVMSGLAFIAAPKIIYDDTYSNKSWCIVGQGMFALWEINQMEREMCSYLEWQLSVDPLMLRDFQARVRHEFAGPCPYLTTVLPQPAPAP